MNFEDWSFCVFYADFRSFYEYGVDGNKFITYSAVVAKTSSNAVVTNNISGLYVAGNS